MLDQYRTINIDLCAQANIPYINMRQAFVDAVPSSFHGYSGYVVNQFIPPPPPPHPPHPLLLYALSSCHIPSCIMYILTHVFTTILLLLATHFLQSIYPSIVQPCIKVSYHRWRA